MSFTLKLILCQELENFRIIEFYFFILAVLNYSELLEFPS